MTTNLQLLVDTALSPEARLPAAPPLTLTRNFAWVVCFCVATLLTVPFLLAWCANILLN